MEPITISIVGAIGLQIIKMIRDKKVAQQEAEKANQLPAALEFTREQLALFTHQDGPLRAFDTDTADHTMKLLELRSVQPVSEPDIAGLLASVGGGQIWRVVPLTPGLPRAADVVRQAAASGRAPVICGSHSLALLPNGSLSPMVLVIGGPGIEGLCDAGIGRFALLRPLAKAPAIGTATAAASPPPTPRSTPSSAPAVAPEGARPVEDIIAELQAIAARAAPVTTITPSASIASAATVTTTQTTSHVNGVANKPVKAVETTTPETPAEGS